jgi:hypothetical protein
MEHIGIGLSRSFGKRGRRIGNEQEPENVVDAARDAANWALNLPGH